MIWKPGSGAARTADGITEADFRRYIAAFNAGDFAGFGKFFAQNLDFEGRAGHFRGRDETVAFYTRVKARLREKLSVRAVILGEQGIAADVVTDLHALEDWPDFPTGPLRRGESRRSENFIWYETEGGRFKHIRSAHYRTATSTADPEPATVAASAAVVSGGNGQMMSESRFREYIDAFNRDDYSKFGQYYDEDVVLVIAGKQELRGRQAIFDFYKVLKAQTRRVIQINKLIIAQDQLATELQSEFLALQDLPDFPAGPMQQGGRIFINTFVFYELRDGKFARIRSAEFKKIASRS